MAYISGNTSEPGRIVIINEDNWSLEKNRLIDNGNYRINDLDDGKKLVFCRRNDGKSNGFGNIDTAIEHYQVFSCGQNIAGGLGHDDTENRSVFTQIGTDTDWKSVVCCSSHTLALKTNGTLWGCGLNTDGQLGLNDRVNRSTLIQIGSATDWKSVSGGGSSHTLTLKTDGTMWSCGSNWAGQLGLGNTVSRSTLTQIGTATNWGFIGCGGHHTLAVKTDGTLWSCGYNVYGQLGLDGGGNRSTLIQIGTDSSWSSVVCGSSHTLALK